MNKVMLIGNLTRDPELRYSQSSEPIAILRFSLAVNRRFKKEGQPDADFINCVSFGKQGEIINQYFKKGNKIAIEGSIQTSSWDDKETGQKRYGTDVIVDNFHFVESKASRESMQSSNSGGDHYDDMASSYSSRQASSPSNDFETMEIDDDDLPF